MSTLHDPLQLPLDGIRAVEANAGTGKTFTIAALYLRLILERGLQPEEIVVATFTRAATAELSERLRAWLALADRQLHGDEPDRLRDGEQGEAAMLRRIVTQAREHLARSGDADAPHTLRRRAREAAFAIDTAQISTLHGFCHRVLNEFGFETGQALRDPELIDDVRALELEIVRDFWRSGSADPATARMLAETWKSPEVLAAQVCDPRWRGRVIVLPDPDSAGPETELARIRPLIAAWSDAALAQADREIGRSFGHPSARKPRCNALRVLRDWARGHLAGDDSDAIALTEANRFDPAEMERLGSFRSHPAGDVFDLVHALRPALAALLAARTVRAQMPVTGLLCSARSYLETELPMRLAARNLMSHDQAVDRLAKGLADPARGAAAIARIRARWKAALVDEFQDTDDAQWEVVQKLFGESTLILVGDPKQAIYGFRGGDVFAWRKAVDCAAGAPLALTTSYRSGARLCAAVNALFRGNGGFIDADIEYRDVAASERSTRCAVLRDGAPLPGLACWSFTAAELGEPDDGTVAKERARVALERRTVRHVAALLASATLRRGDGTEEPLQPKHLAVLVNDNREAAAMQAALAVAGIPACSNLRASVYASEEADDLALLLEALAEPADADRARAAWASRLLGRSAAEIAATLAGADGAPQREAGEWSDAVRRHGVLMWLHGLVAAAAPRLLALPDGARRVSNYLQLAERLQDDAATCFGPADLAARFARRRAESGKDSDADSARLRLDSDADAVTVSTVHAAKGLEYDVVLLPYAGFAKDPARTRRGMALHWYHDDAGVARVAPGSGAANREAQRRAQGEALAEDVRKLYVAVTRARALCVLPWGPVRGAEHGALFHLLHATGRATPLTLGDAGCAAALAALRERAPDAVGIVPWGDIPAAARWQAPEPAAVATAPRRFERKHLERDWSVWSFSRLVRGHPDAAADPLPGAGDGEPGEPGGARFGSAVHQMFERTDFAAWRDADGVPASQRALIERALADQGVAGAALPHTQEVAGAMLRDALNAPLPCGTRLADIAADARRAEIEFHLSLSPADQNRLYALLGKHGYLPQRKGLAAVTRLAGLLTGKIDLTFRHAGRYYLVDWKTNRCPPYDAAALAAEIARHDYDLQWILYTLALHRWLGATLADYDYERDFGGVYYLFVRGMQDGRGVHADRPPRALIEALDALLSAPRREAA